MIAPFNGYLASDGKPFADEIEALRYEAGLELAKSFPELKISIGQQSRLDLLADIIEPYLTARQKVPLAPEKEPYKSDAPVEPWPEAVRDAMSADNLGEVYAHVPRCPVDHHTWAPAGDSLGLIDRCTTCGEERA